MLALDRHVRGGRRRGCHRRTGRPLAGVVAALLGAVLAATGLVALTRPPAAAAAEVYPVPTNGVFQMSGHGWGHGHGMSQWGAQGGAMEGSTAAQITSFYYPNTTLGTVADSPIRVLLQATDGVQVVVTPVSGLTATDVGTGASVALTGSSDYRGVVDSAGLHLQQQISSGWQTLAVGGRLSLAGPLQFSTSASGVLVQVAYPDGTERSYRGVVDAVNWQGQLLAIDTLPMEEYLLGVVPRESPAYFDAAALQAQAIAARSYAAFERANTPAGQPWDICDSTDCQVFGGTTLVSAGTTYSLESASTTQAVQATADEVRLYGGAPIFAQFSSSDGGWTVAGGEPYLIAQADPWDGVPGENVHSWTASVPASALEAAYAGDGLGTLVAIDVTQRDGNGEWGGRVLQAVLQGVNAAGQSTSVATTGAAIAAAFGWPQNSAGLRSNWWTVDTGLAASLVSQSGTAATVVAPGPDAVTVTATLSNTGASSWPISGLSMAPAAGSSGSPVVSSVHVTDTTSPGATAIAPGDTALFSATVSLPGTPVGSAKLSLQPESSGNSFGPVITWPVQLAAAVLGASPVSLPVVAAVPSTGQVTVGLLFRNAGNVAWPSGGLVRLGTALPLGRTSQLQAPNWLSANRVASITALPPAPGQPVPGSVAPGALGEVALTLAGNGIGVGPRAAEGFQLVWDGVAWLGSPVSIPVVIISSAPHDAVGSTGYVTPSIPADPLGHGIAAVTLTNTGSAGWTVGQEVLTVTPADGIAPTTVALGANLTVPGAGVVAPGERGEWLVALRGGPGVSAGPGVAHLTVQAGPASAPYGPVLPVSVTLTPVSLSLALLPSPTPVVIPADGSVTVYLQVRNTGAAALPLRSLVRLAVPAGTPFTSPAWPAPNRIGTLVRNLSAPTDAELGPGQTGVVPVTLDGNATPARSGVLTLSAVWDGYTFLPLANGSLPYRVS